MGGETQFDVARWYAIHTHPRQESRADSNLRAWKVETFAPAMKEYRYSNGTLIQTTKPLFPRYIFARFRANDLLHKVSFTRGVCSVVSFGDNPTPVDDQIIELIKSQINEDGYVRIGEQLKVGDTVMIKDGPFKNLKGIFKREVKHTDRVLLLLTAISYQSHIVIPRGLAKKVSAADGRV